MQTIVFVGAGFPRVRNGLRGHHGQQGVALHIRLRRHDGLAHHVQPVLPRRAQQSGPDVVRSRGLLHQRRRSRRRARRHVRHPAHAAKRRNLA
eukprot:6394919-Pyramimonas_sp.AAC.1